MNDQPLISHPRRPGRVAMAAATAVLGLVSLGAAACGSGAKHVARTCSPFKDVLGDDNALVDGEVCVEITDSNGTLSTKGSVNVTSHHLVPAKKNKSAHLEADETAITIRGLKLEHAGTSAEGALGALDEARTLSSQASIATCTPGAVTATFQVAVGEPRDPAGKPIAQVPVSAIASGNTTCDGKNNAAAALDSGLVLTLGGLR